VDRLDAFEIQTVRPFGTVARLREEADVLQLVGVVLLDRSDGEVSIG
jgi:hypothetical protein